LRPHCATHCPLTAPAFTDLYRSANPSSLALNIISAIGKLPDSTETLMTDLKPAVKAAGSPRQPMIGRLLAAGVLVLAAAGAVVSAHAQGHHGPGMGGPGMMMFGGSPEHIGRAVDHMLDGLNATDAQRTQIKQIAVAAATDLKAQRDAGKGLHERAAQIFTAPNVDANAAESVRQQMLTQHDQASRRVLQAMLDVSRILTPDQRAKLGERMKERHAAMQERMQRMQERHQQQPPK
jgi:protein CpxP